MSKEGLQIPFPTQVRFQQSMGGIGWRRGFHTNKFYVKNVLNISAGKFKKLTSYSECPWNTLTEWIDGVLKSHNLKVVSVEEVTISCWLGWVQVCVSSWSWPKRSSIRVISFSLQRRELSNKGLHFPDSLYTVWQGVITFVNIVLTMDLGQMMKKDLIISVSKFSKIINIRDGKWNQNHLCERIGSIAMAFSKVNIFLSHTFPNWIKASKFCWTRLDFSKFHWLVQSQSRERCTQPIALWAQASISCPPAWLS